MVAARTTLEDRSGSKGIDQDAIDTIRLLAVDAVEKANSGHAGAPMGLAPVAYTLWQEFLRYDPADPLWPNRDRFVLSCGHASMLLYALIHLAGVRRVEDGRVTNEAAVSMDDIRDFRQLGSVTPGHPEYGHTTGVEATTGPLGQGCGDSVGMAIASRWLGAHYNRPGHEVFDFNVYVICSDGDMMEGVASEAASLAGHLGLDNLCWIYDSNHVTIEGSTDLAFTEDVAERFQGYGWHVAHVADANDRAAVRAALQQFRRTEGRPGLIVVNSVIGYGAPGVQGTSKVHSDALGPEEVRKTKAFLGFPEDRDFFVPDGVPARFAEGIGQRGAKARAAWEKGFRDYAAAFPDKAGEIERCLRHELPEGWDAGLPVFAPDAKGIATRAASGKVLDVLAGSLPWLVGGSADLSPSTRTDFSSEGAKSQEDATPGGRILHFGVREHGMGAAVNGMGLCHLRGFGATFLIFSDYMRPAIRLAALMRLPVFHVFTHDSISLGEDGPTHQPVEQLMSLRAMPNLVVLRPADANETVEAYRAILSLKDTPAALILSRQALPVFDRDRYAPASGLARGAYVMADCEGEPQVILIGTGSEVQLCIAAYEELKSRGLRARVVSMPSWELFARQDQSWRDTVLPPHITARVSVEMGATLGWERYAGPTGEIIGVETFGMSAPLKDLLERFGFTAAKVVEAALRQIGQGKAS
ncbi:MAG TPA: transketolase [Paracoccus sp. (in: a-proteobacteria)]|nr:transketolase [Paracoccus sp. (in: a-proteobacteria)]